MAEVKKELEKDIQRAICDWLALRGVFFWRSLSTPALGNPDAQGNMRFRALPKYTPRGIADIIVLHKGEFIGLEVKVKGRKLRPEQAEWGTKVLQAGGSYHCVHSLDEVMELPYW